MSRIPAVDPSQAPAPVKALLDGVHRGLGMTPNMFRVAAQSPAVLEALVAFFGAVGKGKLDGKTRESIALAVSELDGCDYCLSAHSALGAGAGLTAPDLESARGGSSDDPRRAATLVFARRLVETRGHVDNAEVARLREAGLADGEVLEVVANVALTIFTNYLNEVSGADIDFPHVRAHVR